MAEEEKSRLVKLTFDFFEAYAQYMETRGRLSAIKKQMIDELGITEEELEKYPSFEEMMKAKKEAQREPDGSNPGVSSPKGR